MKKIESQKSGHLNKRIERIILNRNRNLCLLNPVRRVPKQDISVCNVFCRRKESQTD
jgi:hypothetical protein